MSSMMDITEMSSPPDAESTRVDGFADDTSTHIPMRSTAQRNRYWRPASNRRVTSSEVKRTNFADFDWDSEDSALHERARGFTSAAANAHPPSSPGRISISMGTPGHDSLYEIAQTPTASFLKAARERVAREEQQQRDVDAVASRLLRVSPTKSNTSETRRSRFAAHKKSSAEEEELAMSPVFNLTAKPSPKRSRFSTARAATSHVSASATFSKPTASPQRSYVASTTPQPERPSTPRSTTNTMGITQNSFGLPDLPNLTELMSGMYKDGTPIFSRSAKSRSRFTNHKASLDGRPYHIPVDSVPVPEDEKAIYASLQLMKEKIAQLEQEKAEADRRLQEYDSEVIDLRVQLDAQHRMRRSDSGFGSDDENKAQKDLRAENTQLRVALESTQKKLAGAQRKLEVNDIALKRVTKERDTAVTQLGTAFYNCEELKSEQKVLQEENTALQTKIDHVTAEYDELRANHTTGGSIENERLRQQLSDMRAQHDEETQRVQFEEAEARLKVEEKARREHSRMQKEKEEIQARLAEAMAKHEEEARQWQARNDEMQNQIEDLEENTQQMQTATLAQAAEDLRRENEKLRTKLSKQQPQQPEKRQSRLNHTEDLATLNRELEEVMAQHEEDSLVWSRKEVQLKEKIARLKAGKSILKKPSANTASQRVESFSSMPAITATASAKPVPVKSRAASARVAQASMLDKKSVPFMSGALPVAAKHDRRVSAPVLSRVPDVAFDDDESTTDLDLSQLQEKKSVKTTKSLPKEKVLRRDTSRYERDDTTLSFMDPLDIQKIRQQVEEDYREAKWSHRPNMKEVSSAEAEFETTTSSIASGLERSVRSPSAKRHQSKQTSSDTTSGLERFGRSPSVVKDAGVSRDDATQSATSASHTRRSSLKQKNIVPGGDDLTATSIKSAKSTCSVGPNVAARESQKPAGASYTQSLEAEYGQRRRRSAPEMTSAFILPDITMRAPSVPICERAAMGPEARKLLDEMSPHDITKCTVCYRLAAENGVEDLPKFSIPQPKPVTDEQNDDVDATMRPAMSPTEALATTIKQLEDELAHKKADLKDNVNLLDGHDPRKGSRFRRAFQRRIDELNEEIRKISQHIYNLMDVLEGQKAAGQLANDQTDNTESAWSGITDTERF